MFFTPSLLKADMDMIVEIRTLFCTCGKHREEMPQTDLWARNSRYLENMTAAPALNLLLLTQYVHKHWSWREASRHLATLNFASPFTRYYLPPINHPTINTHMVHTQDAYNTQHDAATTCMSIPLPPTLRSSTHHLHLPLSRLHH